MKIFGINCLNHDAAISVIEDGEILFAAHSERYSRKKNDMFLNEDIVEEALSYGKPDKVVYYERPYLKKTRQIYSGQWDEVWSLSNLPGRYLKKWFPNNRIQYIGHHKSHAAAGYYTSPYREAAILVDPEDTRSIADGLAELLSDKSRRQRLVERGRDRVMQFTWDACAARAIKVFESVV